MSFLMSCQVILSLVCFSTVVAVIPDLAMYFPHVSVQGLVLREANVADITPWVHWPKIQLNPILSANQKIMLCII